MERSDTELITECLRGDNGSFDCLVKRHQRRVLSLCYRILGDPEEAADAAQKSFVKAYYALPSFKTEAGFPTWLFKIANNTCLDMARQRGKHRTDSMDESLESNEASPEDAVMTSERARLLRRAVSDLPVKLRIPLILFHFEAMSIKDISQALERPEGTVKATLHRAREMLRGMLEGTVVEV